MIGTKHIPLSINIQKIICIGVVCSKANDFFMQSNCLVRNKSPPSIFEFYKNLNIGGFFMKENYEINNNYKNKRYEDKTYDEANRYDFYTKRFLQYGIGTKCEGFIEISKKQYNKIYEGLKNNPNADIKLFKTYSVGFYEKAGTYVIQDVDKNVFECLFKSQRYEKNKTKHERERHLNIYFKQDDINHLKDEKNTEESILDKIEDENIRKYLNTILSEKQSRRFYKNKIDEIPLIVIAFEEGIDVAAVKRSVDRAVEKIIKNYKKNKKF